MQIKKKIVISCMVACIIGLVFLCNAVYLSNVDIFYFGKPSPPTKSQIRNGIKAAQEENDTLNSTELTPVQSMERRLPQAIIIGIRKCGTRALLNMLKIHPKIRTASDEIHYFDRDENYKQGLDWYVQQMPLSYPDQITIEKSPAYFITDEAPKRIYQMNPSIKLLLIVRDPTIRVVSDYAQIHLHPEQRHDLPADTFEQLVMDGEHINKDYKAVTTSMYSKHMKKWLALYPKQQIHIVDGDKLVKDPVPELEKVETFLELEHTISYDNFYFNETKGFYCIKYETKSKCLADSKGLKHPDVDPTVMQKLQEFYHRYNERFQEMVGMRFDWL
ncbi:heparan sulfate glucosamine 3-O-sulfotransferase 1-like [Glandiceps talaboti]